jgi:hypothetical protein
MYVFLIFFKCTMCLIELAMRRVGDGASWRWGELVMGRLGEVAMITLYLLSFRVIDKFLYHKLVISFSRFFANSPIRYFSYLLLLLFAFLPIRFILYLPFFRIIYHFNKHRNYMIILFF